MKKIKTEYKVSLNDPQTPLQAPGGPWRPLEVPAGPWRPLEAPGGPCRSLEAPGPEVSPVSRAVDEHRSSEGDPTGRGH